MNSSTEMVYSSKPGKSYYSESIQKFINVDPKFILGVLFQNGFDITDKQRDAWVEQIQELQLRLKESECIGDIIFEYDIVRLGKRIDVVLLIKHMVFSLEFKNGASSYLAQDKEQAEDYALDLKNFHKESADLYVCPILVATEAKSKKNTISVYDDKQVRLQFANNENLMDCIENVYRKYGSEESIDFDAWYNSPYCPTPTIIAATTAAYLDNNVKEIAHSEAGQENIDACERTVEDIIKFAKENKKKCLCFVTGVPGAGKTLVGLDIAAKVLPEERKKRSEFIIDPRNNKDEGSQSVYISGNAPLVKVLRASLVNDYLDRAEKYDYPQYTKKRIQTCMSYLIQDAYAFRKHYLVNQKELPAENIVVFDEAQRCWDSSKLMKFIKDKLPSCKLEKDYSEPEYFLEIMNRLKDDWAVIVCLVGLGQDIHDGEVGINGWFDAVLDNYPDWHIFYSDELLNQKADPVLRTNALLAYDNKHIDKYLHLDTSLRSFRSEYLSRFVDALLLGNVADARECYTKLEGNYPLYITRDFKAAKRWARHNVRGSQRCGVLACSDAQRLKPEGIYVSSDISVEHWFLSPSEDIRSSNAMEVVAREFDIQGLEIDWSVVCWDADLRRSKDSWDYYKWSGSSWNHRNKIDQQRYLLNAYRVLLTRARQGMVIFVPCGDLEEDEDFQDKTRKPEFYDAVYEYLHDKCRVKVLEP